MTHVPIRTMLASARAGRYAVAAINVVDVVTMDGVLAGAASVCAPVIVQTAARTAQTWGPDVLVAAFTRLAERHPTPAAIQLDHCADEDLIGACLAAGWDGVLFDGSRLDPAANRDATIRLRDRAHGHGASIEAELESIRGSELGVATGVGAARPIEDSIDFVARTGIDCFAPYIGNVHGRAVEPAPIDIERARLIAAALEVPLALHGGTGIEPPVLDALIAAGCAKVNFSTQLREACDAALRDALRDSNDDPIVPLAAMREAATQVARDCAAAVGSVGRG